MAVSSAQINAMAAAQPSPGEGCRRKVGRGSHCEAGDA